MKKSYLAPALEGIGQVAASTSAFGTDPAPDVSEFPQVPADTGSFDICEEEICGG